MKKNNALLLAISIPLLFLIFVLVLYFVPRYFASPSYDYVYFEADYSSSYFYQVEDNKITLQERTNTRYSDSNNEKPTIYLHNIKENQSSKIDQEEAKDLNIISTDKSPDGFEFVSSMRGVNFFPLFVDTTNKPVVKGKGSIFQQNIEADYYNIEFLGWIE
ncbi:hypothetical protein [Candidatus Absconditicoccus praedator]|uniref:hypothetical protein n=1 Tax=Candidatus Absconditicoccus praedator TaxID=2735562 RepID=UPI001E4F4680|nr:hypothetical protein [Candidatus Absconditicoccus praedator]UFX83177.1 hypothetical protein HLG78_03520 [Candidatus Absconditicoccus praedator]